MHSFRNDYSEGAHPAVLALMQKTNMQQCVGYGEDEFCARARVLIARELDCNDAEIYFISGGTQTNLLAICAALRPHQAVVAATSGHICVHETGAIEATGHKIITVETNDGKLTPDLIKPALALHQGHHMVMPKMLYISNSTEVGTVYDRAELAALRDFCREQGLLLFIDGARLGAALTAPGNQLTLADMAANCDCFSIGGTKNGALLGEALVITNKALQEDIAYIIKQRGALLAKGRLLGLQFVALFENGLYYENARHANEMALLLKAGLQERGYSLLVDSPTNQQFVVLPHRLGQKLALDYGCEVWQQGPQDMCIRIVTSWATPVQAVEKFLAELSSANKEEGV